MYFYEKCNYSWKKLVLLFNGRTENSIKNRFFSELRKIATKNSVEKIPCSKIKLEELTLLHFQKRVINMCRTCFPYI